MGSEQIHSIQFVYYAHKCTLQASSQTAQWCPGGLQSRMQHASLMTCIAAPPAEKRHSNINNSPVWRQTVSVRTVAGFILQKHWPEYRTDVRTKFLLYLRAQCTEDTANGSEAEQRVFTSFTTRIILIPKYSWCTSHGTVMCAHESCGQETVILIQDSQDLEEVPLSLCYTGFRLISSTRQ